MTVRIVRLGGPRARGGGPAHRHVRGPPRGVPAARFASEDWYDVWYPELAPSVATMKLGKAARTERAWAAFARKFRAEMGAPGASRARPVSRRSRDRAQLLGRVLLRGRGALPPARCSASCSPRAERRSSWPARRARGYGRGSPRSMRRGRRGPGALGRPGARAAPRPPSLRARRCAAAGGRGPGRHGLRERVPLALRRDRLLAELQRARAGCVLGSPRRWRGAAGRGRRRSREPSARRASSRGRARTGRRRSARRRAAARTLRAPPRRAPCPAPSSAPLPRARSPARRPSDWPRPPAAARAGDPAEIPRPPSERTAAHGSPR